MTALDWYWGVDVRTRLIAIAALNQAGAARWWSIEVPDGRGAQRLLLIRQAVYRFADNLSTAAPDLMPTAITVEMPLIRTADFRLLAATGVTMEALQTVCACPILELTSSAWKLKAIGYGAAKKPQVLEHARTLGYTGDLQDEADALVIAQATRVMATWRQTNTAVAFRCAGCQKRYDLAPPVPAECSGCGGVLVAVNAAEDQERAA